MFLYSTAVLPPPPPQRKEKKKDEVKKKKKLKGICSSDLVTQSLEEYKPGQKKKKVWQNIQTT